MRFVIFTHSLKSDWNHGNAHFLRGIALELLARKHEVSIFEPANSWSRTNLLREQGQAAIDGFHTHFPSLQSQEYDESEIDLDIALDGADVVLVHEWNTPEIVAAIGLHRSSHDYQLFFHDTHHRALTSEAEVSAFDLKHYDGVLAYGNAIRDVYRGKPAVRDAFTWHEAADVRTFHPFDHVDKQGDLVWIGNWGDGERQESLRSFLIEPVTTLGIKARVYGVRYPQSALNELSDSGIEYGGWLPNYKVPEVFARYRVTVHVPREPYTQALPGIPTIRPFEALACGIPLVSAPWHDVENLFTPGRDFIFANDGRQMTETISRVLGDRALGEDLAAHGLNTIRSKHTCGHRIDELITLTEASKSVEMAGGGG